MGSISSNIKKKIHPYSQSYLRLLKIEKNGVFGSSLNIEHALNHVCDRITMENVSSKGHSVEH